MMEASVTRQHLTTLIWREDQTSQGLLFHEGGTRSTHPTKKASTFCDLDHTLVRQPAASRQI